ncbi:hypothetical protein BLNAU_9521 [Blattamonas nauphoetae]|uniref:Uncharacterized protein n=1 Tax=Blattamonas nauphoetae TaxID=2049346 RepID=A0ABQ9XVG0_9EUKA|nr:hypothetical protein BLNAU_9521 [Blattamonas nauphoetae]
MDKIKSSELAEVISNEANRNNSSVDGVKLRLSDRTEQQMWLFLNTADETLIQVSPRVRERDIASLSQIRLLLPIHPSSFNLVPPNTSNHLHTTQIQSTRNPPVCVFNQAWPENLEGMAENGVALLEASQISERCCLSIVMVWILLEGGQREARCESRADNDQSNEIKCWS